MFYGVSILTMSLRAREAGLECLNKCSNYTVHIWKMKETVEITDGKKGRKEGREEEEEEKRWASEESKKKRKKRGTFGTRKLKMITHLLSLYSTLLGLRRKKKGEVFRLVLLLLPLLLSPRRFLAAHLNVCHFHYATCTYFAFPFVYPPSPPFPPPSFCRSICRCFRVISFPSHADLAGRKEEAAETSGGNHRCLFREILMNTRSSALSELLNHVNHEQRGG